MHEKKRLFITEVEKRAARFISKFPFKFNKIGNKMNSSVVFKKTSQCLK